MLSIFPIHFLSLFAYFILRGCIGLILLYLGFKHFQFRNELKHVLQLSWWPFGTFTTITFAFFEILLGGFILLGAYTQLATLFVAIMCLKMLVMRNWFDHHSIPSKLFYFLLLGASLSLTITGAGAFAFDLPF